MFGTWNHESAYLTGILAGYLGKSGTFGSVGGYPIPEVNRLINAFRLGAKEKQPNAKFLVSFLGTWFDPAKAKEQGLAQIDGGADLLFGERIGTADAAKERGKLSIGSLLDYTPRYPKVVFANAVWYFDPILAAALADVAAGKPTGRDYSEYSFMSHGGNELSSTPAWYPLTQLPPWRRSARRSSREASRCPSRMQSRPDVAFQDGEIVGGYLAQDALGLAAGVHEGRVTATAA